MTIAYWFEGKVYLNLTNKCSNDCVFCIRNNQSGVGGVDLWLEREPKVVEAIQALDDVGYESADEVVFCGFGEPTYRMDAVVQIGQMLKSKGKTVRLDTNGCGSLINGLDIVPMLQGCVDKVSISLNASNAQLYNQICKPEFGEAAFGAIIDFAKACKALGIDTQFSVVDEIGKIEIEQCEQLCKELGIRLRVREYIA